ncbi:hypothetical protein D0Z67_09915 [Streptomyces seoulensis]|uniref:Uncharacterized protein n=1 Tax=Streptomyces seoulensis TaxID=73044 RepID=A0A4P6TVH0_STRSO|nr:hypothetical protein D0Z67_09915 [Streptomyces seoulensis]
MLNRIRRALSLSRVRTSTKGRHRRPLRPSDPSASSLAPTDASTVVLRRPSTTKSCLASLGGEEVALVRPYVLAWERRARPRALVVVPHLPAEAWSALAGVH